jgi:hypothetical protein
MPEFLDHLRAEILALQRSLDADPRTIKLRELRRVEALYGTSAAADSPPAQDSQPLIRKSATREMSAETRQVIEEAERFLVGHSDPVPLREMYHQVVEIRGCQIGGQDPINGLSAILSRAGKFKAHGRSGWTLKTTEELTQERNANAIAFYRKADPELAELYESNVLPRPYGSEME